MTNKIEERFKNRFGGDNWLGADRSAVIDFIASELKLQRETAYLEGQKSVGIIGAYDAIVEQARKDGRELGINEATPEYKKDMEDAYEKGKKDGRELGRKELLEKLPKEKEVRKDFIFMSNPDIALKQVVNEGFNSALKEVRKIILYE